MWLTICVFVWSEVYFLHLLFKSCLLLRSLWSVVVGACLGLGC